LDPSERLRFLEHGTQLDFAPGGVIIDEGEINQSIYLVVDGEISVQREASVPDTLVTYVELTRLGVGEIFGEMSFLTRSKATARIVAAGPVRLLEMAHKKLNALMLVEPSLAAAFLPVGLHHIGAPFRGNQ
jgi:CRP-like cAMP-binding protein